MVLTAGNNDNGDVALQSWLHNQIAASVWLMTKYQFKIHLVKRLRYETSSIRSSCMFSLVASASSRANVSTETVNRSNWLFGLKIICFCLFLFWPVPGFRMLLKMPWKGAAKWVKMDGARRARGSEQHSSHHELVRGEQSGCVYPQTKYSKINLEKDDDVFQWH